MEPSKLPCSIRDFIEPARYFIAMITRVLSQKWVLLVIGLAAGSGILIPASYGSFHPVTSAEIQDGTIQTVDLANNGVTSAKIRDATITDNDLGADSVGANEIKGVTKLIFGHCPKEDNDIRPPDTAFNVICNIFGVDSDDNVIAAMDKDGCMMIQSVKGQTNFVVVRLHNTCDGPHGLGPANFSVIAYDK